jgi:hypothetical protein
METVSLNKPTWMISSGKQRYAHEELKLEMSVLTEPALLVRRISLLFDIQKPTMVYTYNEDCIYKTEQPVIE